MTESKHISIWFFTGALVAVYGALILGAGIVQIFQPPQPPVVLENLHFGAWWGGILLVLGAAAAWRARPRRARTKEDAPARTQRVEKA